MFNAVLYTVDCHADMWSAIRGGKPYQVKELFVPSLGVLLNFFGNSQNEPINVMLSNKHRYDYTLNCSALHVFEKLTLSEDKLKCLLNMKRNIEEKERLTDKICDKFAFMKNESKSDEPSEDTPEELEEKTRMEEIKDAKNDYVLKLTPSEIIEWKNDNTDILLIYKETENDSFVVKRFTKEECDKRRFDYNDSFSYNKSTIMDELLYKPLIDE